MSISVSGLAQLPRVVLALVVLLWSGGSVYSYWREQPRVVPGNIIRSSPPPRASVPLDGAALALLFGLAPAQPLVVSAAPLKLRASLVGASGPSRAQLAGDSGERFYREGEQLPDGSLLRAVYPNRVVLWRNGREESLVVDPSTTRYFKPSAPVRGTDAVLLVPVNDAGVRP